MKKRLTVSEWSDEIMEDIINQLEDSCVVTSLFLSIEDLACSWLLVFSFLLDGNVTSEDGIDHTLERVKMYVVLLVNLDHIHTGHHNMPEELEMEGIDHALERLNQRRWWIWSVFILASSPGLFNAYHIMVSLFFASIPPYWCRIPQLVDTHWTNDQIRNISSPTGLTGSSCSMISWNYTYLATMDYKSALQFVASHPKPSESPCTQFMYDEEVPYSSTVSQWDLVCDNLPKKSNIQSSIAIGKFVGGFLFGFIADKYGRKSSFVLASLTYIIMGPLAAFSPSYWLFIVARFFLGIAGSGCYESAYTI
ncbi:hypothetical protein J6590_061996, partial [Homalodisca vitripennis]